MGSQKYRTWWPYVADDTLWKFFAIQVMAHRDYGEGRRWTLPQRINGQLGVGDIKYGSISIKHRKTPHSVVFQNSESVCCKSLKSLDKCDTRSIRLCSGLAQKQLAAKACVPTARLSRIERDVEGPF